MNGYFIGADWLRFFQVFLQMVEAFTTIANDNAQNGVDHVVMEELRLRLRELEVLYGQGRRVRNSFVQIGG